MPKRESGRTRRLSPSVRGAGGPVSTPSRHDGAPALAPLRVAIATGPALVREVLGRALGQEDGLSVVGHAATESEIAETLRVAPPEVLLFDYEALGPNGEAVISRVRREFPKTRILVLATRSGPETVERVLHAGASGLVGKESDLLTLVRALRSVANGEIWANRRDTARALERLALVSGRHVGSAGTLTRRETEIVEWVGHGLRNKEIAHRLRINEKTVKTHLNNIFRKLHVDSRIALALLGASQPLPKT